MNSSVEIVVLGKSGITFVFQRKSTMYDDCIKNHIWGKLDKNLLLLQYLQISIFINSIYTSVEQKISFCFY